MEAIVDNDSTGLGVSTPSFRYNHPKNYFGIPVAVAAPGSTGALVQAYIVRGAGAAKRGAQQFGLLTDKGGLTRLGDQVATHARLEYGSLGEALERFGELKGSTKRFVCVDDGVWKRIGKEVVMTHPVSSDLVELLDSNGGEMRLPELAHAYIQADPQRAHQVMIRDTVELPTTDGEIADRLFDPGVYRTAITCQLKSILYHSGVLTEPGSDSRHLVPETDAWKIDGDAYVNGGEQL